MVLIVTAMNGIQEEERQSLDWQLFHAPLHGLSNGQAN